MKRKYFNIDCFNSKGEFDGAIFNGSYNCCINENIYNALLKNGIYEYPDGEYLEARE